MYGERAPREVFDVVCAECGVETTVPFKPDGSRPVKCRDCFQKDRPPRDGPRGGPRGDRQEFDVICATCGVETTVPFQPRGDRPVQCRDCYQQSRPPRDGPRGGGGGGGRSFGGGDREMHDATCSRCGSQTQVPFKPAAGRDVFCRDCYQRR